ncbi:Senescence-specific cysteine protease sag12 [Orobanche gracilis]
MMSSTTSFTSGDRMTRSITTSFKYKNFTHVPASIDWRQRGAATPIKDQGGCGAFWAFAAVAAIEGKLQIASGKLVSLSEQELLDCVESSGCADGYEYEAFDYVTKKGGMCT